MPIEDLREWLRLVEEMGELQKLDGVHWDAEMGPLTQYAHERLKDKVPALLFDNVPGYPTGYRNLYAHFSTAKRVALSLGLPLDLPSKIDYVKAYQRKVQEMKPIPPQWVEWGPVMENIHTGSDINVLEFPVPRHHEQDTHRFVATASVIVTKDPDSDWINLGTYRSMVYEPTVIGCQITEGKHGRIFRDKYFARGEPMKVAICCGQDPLLYLSSCMPIAEGMSEYDFAGGVRGQAVPVVRGVYTGLPVPATAEIVIEGDLVMDDRRPEGPFGEWMGYYCTKQQSRPVVHIKSIMHRNNPILCNAPQHKPVDETGLLKSIAVSGVLWEQLRGAGIPDIRGVWQMEGGAGARFTVVSIKQRYPGHARQVLHVTSGCQAGAYNGKWVVVVDDDIDPADPDQVMWAMSTRFDPLTDIDVMQRAWSSGRDPMVVPGTGNFNNRIMIDACIPYERMLNGTFPDVVDVSPELKQRFNDMFPHLLFPASRGGKSVLHQGGAR